MSVGVGVGVSVGTAVGVGVAVTTQGVGVTLSLPSLPQAAMAVTARIAVIHIIFFILISVNFAIDKKSCISISHLCR